MKTRYKILLCVSISIVIVTLFSIFVIYFSNDEIVLESDYNNDPSRVLNHCAQQKYGEENDWKTPDGKFFAVTSIGLYAMNETHYIDNNLCTWIERPFGLNTMLSGSELKFYKQKLVRDKAIIEKYKEVPEVVAFYAKYNDALVSVRDDHMSYVSGSDDGLKIRMKLFFDENYAIIDKSLACYYKKAFQFESSPEDVLYRLQSNECKQSTPDFDLSKIGEN